jgi:hypothetical protein
METWHDPDLDRPITAPLERCAQLLGVDLTTAPEAASKVEPPSARTASRSGASCSLSGSSGLRRSVGDGAATSTVDGPQAPNPP